MTDQPSHKISLVVEMAELAASMLSKAYFDDDGDRYAAGMVRRAIEGEIRHALATSKPVAEVVKVKRVMNDPCIAKLKDDEPFFVLLGRDPDAAHALSTWFSYRVRREGRSSKTDAAEKTLDAFRAYRDGDTPPQPEAQGDKGGENSEGPIGWKLVPIEPTDAMMERGAGSVCSLTIHGARSVYTSMIAEVTAK